MALCMFLSWSPPMLEPWFLAVWYFVVMLVCSWCWQQITIATQAGAVECYPFKGERVAVEGFNVVFTSLGIICAVLLIAVAYQYPLVERPSLRLGLGLACAAIGMTSLPAALAMKDARQPSDSSIVSFRDAIKELSANRAFQWMVAANVCDGASGTIRTSFYLYYYTYVAKLTDKQIAVWIAAVPIIILVLKSVAASFWGRFLKGRHRTPRIYTVVGRLLDAAQHVVIYGLSTSIEGFLAGQILHQLLTSPRTFWAITARGWVIDEDAHRDTRRRRESLFTGVSSALAKVSAPLAAAVVAGQAVAGIDTTAPRTFEQPESGVLYIRAVYFFLCPALDLMQAYLLWNFPIHGDRLHTLERAQTRSFKVVSSRTEASKQETGHD
jgi:Na+/melibiose symporter-like transporter